MNKIIDINGFKAVVNKININIQDVRDIVINKADKDHTHNDLAAISYVDEAIANISIDLNNKVDKVEGKSLMLDTEIERLANVSNYDDTALKQRVGNLEAIDHSQFLIEHQDLSEYAKKTEVPAQPNFTYQINMVASDQQPSVTTTGTYPNLVITFNIPQGAGGGTGGNDGPVDTGTPRMWIGYMYYDETGATGFNSPDGINENMTKAEIDKAVTRGGLKEMDPQTIDKYACGNTENLPDGGAYVCCIYPKACNYDVQIMTNTIAETYERFGDINSEDGSTGYQLCQQGIELVNQIDGVTYCQSGGYIVSDGMKYYLRVTQL